MSGRCVPNSFAYFPETMSGSAGFTPHAITRTRTSFSFGSGRGASSYLSTFGPPYSCATIAFIIGFSDSAIAAYGRTASVVRQTVPASAFEIRMRSGFCANRMEASEKRNDSESRAVARAGIQRELAHSRRQNMHWKILITSFALVSSAIAQTTPAPTTAGSKRPFTFEDMMKLKRVGAPVPSPDGKWVVFDAVDVDLDANKKISHLWIVPAAGGEARRLNQTPNHEERPRFSPDGKRLIWTSKATDPTQIWMSNFTPESGGLDGQPHQVTSISTGADGAIWSPDGKNIVFLSSVYPDAKDDAANKQRDEELGKSKVKAKIFTTLLYRHWTSYTEFKRSHLFAVSAEADASQANAARDLTPGDHDVPPFNLGGRYIYSISHDSAALADSSNVDQLDVITTYHHRFSV